MVDAVRKEYEDAPKPLAPGAPCSIEYHNTAEDLTAWHAARGGYYRWLRRVPLVAILVLVVLLADFIFRGQPPSRAILLPLFALALFSSLFRDAEERRLRAEFQIAHEQGRQRVAISPGGLATQFPPKEVLWAWRQVRLEGDDRSLYFYCGHGDAAEVLVIPRRVFQSPSEADAFLALAQSYRARSIEG